jgi:outer membrane protein
MRNKLFLFVGAAALLFGMQTISAAELKVGTVDFKKVFSEAPQVAKIRSKLQQQFEPRSKELGNIQKTLQADIAHFNKDNAVMKDQEKKDLQSKIVAEQNKLQTMQSSIQNDAVGAQNQAMQSFYKDVQAAVAKEAGAKKLDLVLVKDTAIYSNPGVVVDVTDGVISNLKK